jgi:hypothetical protein
VNYPQFLEKWEACVRDSPSVAFQIGPPNWLVKEQQRKGEDFLEAAQRVKAKYFPDGSPNRTAIRTETPERTNSRTGRPKKWANESERLKAYRERAKTK